MHELITNNENESFLTEMIDKFKRYRRDRRFNKALKKNRYYINRIHDIDVCVERYRKENQSISGQVRILEEQQQLMHNFIVEINKYLLEKKIEDMKYLFDNSVLKDKPIKE